ncbi:hypothetical protein [uncultured Amnibacterium sp.]|uniref:hypothetical protein n=1 Tax=uncultured Amnibacterium sp. TaxID=1631851 RepID=UPI0035CBAFC6
MPVLTVRTKDGAVYSLDYREVDDVGERLTALRHGGPDDPPTTNSPMAAGRWFVVAMLTPLPPVVGSRMAMVLNPVEGDADPIVRYSTTVMSVVGVL